MKRFFMISSEVKVDFDMDWTRRMSRWFPVVVALFLFAACSGDDPETGDLPPGVTEGSPSVGVAAPTAASPSPSSSTPAGAASCPNETAAAEDPALQIGASSTTGIDDDGVPDQVHLAMDPNGGEGCTAFVVVELGTGEVAAASVWEIGSAGGLPQPRIHSFVNIDGRAGEEILVDEAAGASTQFVGAFVYVGDDLERITVDGGIGSGVSGAADLFPYGGSVGHIEAVDCVEDRIVVSSATPSADPGAAERGVYEFKRRFYSFHGSVLEKGSTEVHEVPIEDLNRFPEYGGSPFGSC